MHRSPRGLVTQTAEMQSAYARDLTIDSRGWLANEVTHLGEELKNGLKPPCFGD